jgi:hypothetical protein
MSPFVDAPFVLRSGDGQAGELVTLYLTIAVSSNAPPHPILPIDTAHAMATGMDVSPMEQATEPTIADEATRAINLTSTLKSTVERIKWVVDTVNPVAGVRHSAMSSYLFLD